MWLVQYQSRQSINIQLGLILSSSFHQTSPIPSRQSINIHRDLSWLWHFIRLVQYQSRHSINIHRDLSCLQHFIRPRVVSWLYKIYVLLRTAISCEGAHGSVLYGPHVDHLIIQNGLSLTLVLYIFWHNKQAGFFSSALYNPIIIEFLSSTRLLLAGSYALFLSVYYFLGSSSLPCFRATYSCFLPSSSLSCETS